MALIYGHLSGVRCLIEMGLSHVQARFAPNFILQLLNIPKFYYFCINKQLKIKTMTTQNSTINQMIDQLCRLVTNVEDEKESPFEALAYFKALESFIKDAQKQVMEVALHDSRFEDKTFSKGSHQFTKVNGRTVWNFKKLKDWSDTKQQLKSIEDKYKTAFRNSQNGLTLITGDGEVLELPEVTYTKDTLSIKLDSNKIL